MKSLHPKHPFHAAAMKRRTVQTHPSTFLWEPHWEKGSYFHWLPSASHTELLIQSAYAQKRSRVIQFRLHSSSPAASLLHNIRALELRKPTTLACVSLVSLRTTRELRETLVVFWFISQIRWIKRPRPRSPSHPVYNRWMQSTRHL